MATARERLWESAVDQYGFVTTDDVADAGLTKAMIDNLVGRRRLTHVAHGVYRFPEIPATEFDPYMLAVLWTGAPEACLSHDTALAAYELRRRMTSDSTPAALNELLGTLRAKDKEPRSASVLIGWVNQAEQRLGVAAAGGRLGRLIASTVVIAAFQGAVDASGTSLFLLKGGTLLQHRLGQASRATKDVDGLIRGASMSSLRLSTTPFPFPGDHWTCGVARSRRSAHRPVSSSRVGSTCGSSCAA